MHAIFRLPLIALPIALAAAVPTFAADQDAAPAPAPAAAAPAAPAAEVPEDKTIKLSATLSGANEVDAQGAGGKGDTDGTGSFTASIDKQKGQICYTLTWSGIDDPTMAHIHAGAAGKNGPVTVGLPDLDPGEHCIDLDSDRSGPLIRKSDQFYVNIHNGDFPAGAVRGQLTK